MDADGGGSPELIYEAAKREYDSEGDAAPDIQQTSVFGPQLSPDGTQIAYFEGMGDWGNSLWVMDADGSDRRPIIDDTVGEGLVHAASLGWSPDGTRLVFEGAGGIYVVGVDDSALTNIAAGDEGDRSAVVARRLADRVPALRGRHAGAVFEGDAVLDGIRRERRPEPRARDPP